MRRTSILPLTDPENKWADLNEMYWYQKSFSDEEIEIIDMLASNLPSQSGKVEESGDESVQRSSTIKWMKPSDNTAWLYQKLGEYINVANEAVWKFNWDGHTDTIQYTEYYASEKGKYDWHIDIGNGSMSMRKISAVLLLNDDYEGGKLQIKDIGDNLEGNKGDLYIFPSYLLHRVTPVLKGTRRSLVVWAGGPEPFK